MKKIRRTHRIPRDEPMSGHVREGVDKERASLGLLRSEYQESQKERMKTDTELAMDFLSASENGDRAFFDAYIKAGHDVNVQDPRTGLTALHISGGLSSKYQVRALVKSGRCNFLIRDAQKRLPSDVAFANSVYPEIHRYLSMLERRQAELNGVDLRKE